MDTLVNFISPSGNLDLRTLIGFFVFCVMVDTIVKLVSRLGGLTRR